MELFGKEFEGPIDLNSNELPESHGIYIFVNGKSSDFSPLYVGKAKNICMRVKSHISRSSLSIPIEKGEVDKVYYCLFDNEYEKEAYNFEIFLQEHFQPKYNHMYRPININKEYIVDMKRYERASAKRSIISLGLISIFLSFLSAVLAAYISSTSYTPKVELQEKIIMAVENGADLRAVKNIYSNREEKSKGLLSVFASEQEYYPFNVPLSSVLDDIRTGMFISKNKSSIEQVDSIIEQHTQINPFDRLEPIQRDYFENIRLKLDGNYSLVSMEVNKIANELFNKNALVEKYLKDSSTSFLISIIALMFSVIVSSYQIFNGRSSRTKRLIAESMSSVLRDEDET